MQIQVIKVIISFFLFCWVSSWAQTASETNQEIQVFSVQALQSDLDELFETLEAIHPDLYFYTTADSIQKLRNTTIAQINHPMTAREFWKLVAPIVVQLGDGHTGLHFSHDDYYNYFDSSNVVLPFEVDVRDDRLYVAKSYGTYKLVDTNAEIIEINGIKTDSILRTMRKYHFGERKSFIDIKTEMYFNIYLWVLFDIAGNFDLTFVSAEDGEIHKHHCNGITYSEFSAARKAIKPVAKNYSFYTIPDSRIGVVEFNSMLNNEKFRQFTDSAFQIIMADSLKDLIIDVRKNGGGNSMLVNTLFRHFNTKPFTQATKMEIKVSKQSRKQFRKMLFKWYSYPLYPLALFSKNTRPVLFGRKGKIVEYDFEPKSYTPHKLFFEGDVYLLTGPNTFSSANILSAVFKCYEMGTVIGEETGGVTIAFGDIIHYKLSNTGLTGICSFKRFHHPCGALDNHGVIPDIEVKQTPEDLKKGKDTVLDFTVDYILKN